MANAWTLLVRMQADVRQMEYALSSVERRMGGLEGALGRTGRNMSATGRAMTIGITAPLIAMGGGAIKAAADWESAFAGVKKVLDEADLERAHTSFAQINDELRELGREIAIEGGVNTLAAIAERGGALGIQADRIVEFTEVMAKLAATTDLTADAAADAFGHMNTTMQFTEGEIQTMASALVHLGNNGASTESEIVNMASSIAGAGDIIHLGNEQVLAWAAAMANTGEKTQAGATSIQRFFLSAFEAMTGAEDKMDVFERVLGKSEKAIQAAFGEDSHQVLVDFIDELGKLSESEQLEALEELDLGTERRIRAFLRLLANTENLTDANKTLAESQDGINKMDEEFAKRADTLNFQLQLMWQRLYDAGIELGESLVPIIRDDLLPILEDGIGYVRDFAEWFAQLPEPVRKTALQAGILAAALGPLLFIFGGLFQFLGGTVHLLKTFGGLAGGLIGGIGRMTGRGQGPLAKLTAQPVFVTNWPPGFGGPGFGGPGGVGGKGGKGVKPFVPTSFLGKIGAFMSVVAAGTLWAEAVNLGAQTQNMVAEGQAGLVEIVKDRSQGATLDELIKLREDLKGQIERDMGNPLDNFLKWLSINPTLEDQLKDVNARILELQQEGALRVDDRAMGPGRDASATAAAADVASSFDKALTQNFGGKIDKLATDEVLKALGRTTEMGLKGVGTSVEYGIKTGMDPLGDIATRILLHAENPKAPPVMAEIKGHLLGLEEIQQTYLDRGDINLAAKVQKNIDALNELLGTEDAHRAVTEAMAEQAASADAAMLNSAANATAQLTSKADQIKGAASSDAAMLNNTGLNTKAAINEFNASEANRFANLTSRVSAVEAAIDRMHSTLASKNFTNVIQNSYEYYERTGSMGGAAGARQRGNIPIHYDVGAWSIPEDQLAFLHEKEMVVPAKPAQAWRDAQGSFGTPRGDVTEVFKVEVDGLIRVERPSDLLRPMKHLARGRRLNQPRYGFRNGQPQV